MPLKGEIHYEPLTNNDLLGKRGFWVGKLLEHPEIMTQGETLEELEENLRDAHLAMAMDDVPENYQMKEIAL